MTLLYHRFSFKFRSNTECILFSSEMKLIPVEIAVINYIAKRYNSARMFSRFYLTTIASIFRVLPSINAKSCLRWNNGDRNYDHGSNYPRQPNLASNLQPCAYVIYLYLKEKLQHEHNTWNALRDRNGLYCFITTGYVELLYTFVHIQLVICL